MTARGTDWSLALLVALLFASGLGTWFAGDESDAWVFVSHGILGASLAVLLVWKLRRVWRRLVMPERWDRRTIAGALALTLVSATLISGWLWITAGYVTFAGFTVLAWHAALGGVLTLAVLIHLTLRAKRPRTRDFAGRRQLLEGAAIAGAGFVAWRLQAPLNSLLGLPGEKRRFTGSYEADSFAGNAFPTTSWVADDPRPLESDYSLAIDGLVARPLRLTAAELDRGDELVATLDCTGGFYSTQRWRGARLVPLLDRAGPLDGADHVRVISHTGYRWSFSLDDADELLLATTVGDEPLSHGHGAPVRLVAPGRRGFQWVKWVTRLELTAEPDYLAPASTVWSSFTAAGRGSA
jgi:DMSO/TMAO reductase YedYZ molybdopterin-dependent catalytic subunit